MKVVRLCQEIEYFQLAEINLELILRILSIIVFCIRGAFVCKLNFAIFISLRFNIRVVIRFFYKYTTRNNTIVYTEIKTR